MGDSDDEYDRKRRDKFRGERGNDSYRSDKREKSREDYSERTPARARPPEYREYNRPRTRDYSPDQSRPPMKRMRGDWDDMRPRYGHDPYMYGGGFPHHEPYGHGPPPFGNHGPPPGVPRDPAPPSGETQPVMLTLKQFLATQDDSISDSDAIVKYNEYKIEFRRQQLNEFFVAHKDEEW